MFHWPEKKAKRDNNWSFVKEGCGVCGGEKKKELEQGVGNKYRNPNESERDSQPQKTIVVRGL